MTARRWILRYSVDARWAVPHFEKMLYDNGQLVKLYARRLPADRQAGLARVVAETSPTSCAT